MAGLMTPADAAKYLAISTRQLRDLSSAGELVFINIGLRERVTRRYRMDDLQAFIERRTCRSGPVVRQKQSRAGWDYKPDDEIAQRLNARLTAMRAGRTGRRSKAT